MTASSVDAVGDRLRLRPASASAHRPTSHPPVETGRVGVLIVNLGTPEGTDYWSMRRYLKEFLSDPRVIEENRIKWWLILNLIILAVRPGRKGRDYDKIWNREKDESPLKTITRAQAEKLAADIAAAWIGRASLDSSSPSSSRKWLPSRSFALRRSATRIARSGSSPRLR